MSLKCEKCGAIVAGYEPQHCDCTDYYGNPTAPPNHWIDTDSFLQPQVEHGHWYEVKTDNGTQYVPAWLVPYNDMPLTRAITEDDEIFAVLRTALSDYLPVKSHVRSISLMTGWGCRMRAPGYMDCTEWTVFGSKEEAEAFLDGEEW